jgi:molecular chaperone DnaK (HSP70)
MDFDNQLVDELLARFAKQHGQAFTGDPVALSRITVEAERTKIALTERTQVESMLPMLQMTDAGKPLDLKAVITRDEFNALCGELVDRTIDVVKDVLLDAKLKISELDDIVLVGGMSRIPLVRERLKALLGKPALASVNADEAVALGAALYTGTVDKVSNVVLIDVVPMTIGIGLPGGGFKRIIERNTPLPATASFAVSTSKDDEPHLELSLFQGEDSQVAGNEYVGTVRVDELPKGPKGSVQVVVSVKLDAECVLHVEARELRTRKVFKATLATRYTPEQLKARLGISAAPPPAAEGARATELAKRGGRFWSFLKKVVGKPVA